MFEKEGKSFFWRRPVNSARFSQLSLVSLMALVQRRRTMSADRH